jgi:type VI secretion system protein VasG
LRASTRSRRQPLPGARLTSEIAVEHWLLKLLEAGDGDIPALLERGEVNLDALWQTLLESIDRAPRNLRGKPALSLQLATVLEDAWGYASLDTIGNAPGDTRANAIRSAHLLQAIVDAPHVLHTRHASSLLPLSSAQTGRLSTESPPTPTSAADAADVDCLSSRYQPTHARAPATATTLPPSGESLSRFAIDLTEKACHGEIDPVFARDREIQQMVDILVRRRKNNPILVGEPGVGKTALVEGLALRVVEGNVTNARKT